ncbi:hypothetical protein [Sphingomonas sp.]|uniref:hypothetical protein n=1 Tax=Sphingomonas sp. TaxID=28214 RepID=UPI00345C5277
MTRRWIIASAGLALAACGNVADLRPPAGKSLPQKPALAARALTADELLTPPTYARPGRVDELGKRGSPRKADRFDLPPPDGTAALPPADADKPTTSTTGPANAEGPKR